MENIVIIKKEEIDSMQSFAKCEADLKIEENMDEENLFSNSSTNTKPTDSIQQGDTLYKLERKRKFLHLKCKKSKIFSF